MSDASAGIPDLLRRFVPAPHVLCCQLEGINLQLETNDPAIADTLAKATTGIFADARVHAWVLLRDEAAPCDGQEVTIVSWGGLSTILCGSGTVIAVDREQREVVGFLAANITAQEFANRMLPLILEVVIRPVPASADGLEPA
jgi:hypothetical protein